MTTNKTTADKIDKAIASVDAALKARGLPLERERQDDRREFDCDRCQDKGCRHCREFERD